ncbi:Small-conductance mechanosensitive channel [Stieleria maiorica]|uniref:Small-conductance mechanosensitive channel n=1 Tax=Stieleria maiorica TaxID=2795974 RepID=A0A5B9MMU7_9BACT|nr:mechanosensitive ion channel domain-containing protein [Stieleria maiorica]QEG02699.1 Small-conductance mechanosensitive channel [Stieleria maiorica]
MLLAQAGMSTPDPTTGGAPDGDTPPESTLDGALSQMLNADFDGVAEYLGKTVLPNLVPACIGLAVIFCGYFAAKYLSRVISRPIRQRIDETFGRFVGTAIFYSVMLSLIAAVASKLGAPLGGMAAILAAAGFAIGLAFQGTLSNFAAGVLMIVFRPFKVGDVVNIAGVSGKVNEIDLFTTTLDTPDNRRLIIPNSSISGSTIENISFHAHRRVEVIVGVNYDADTDATRQALHAAADAFLQDAIHGEGRGTAVILSNLGDSAVEWKVRMWVKSADYWRMTESLTVEIKRQLDRAGIGIPYPQLDVHLNRVDAAELQGPARPRMRPARRENTSELWRA